jgi:hypothetical protein
MKIWIEKYKYIPKLIEMILFFMKIVISISFVIAHALNHISKLCELFYNFQFINGVFS